MEAAGEEPLLPRVGLEPNLVARHVLHVHQGGIFLMGVRHLSREKSGVGGRSLSSTGVAGEKAAGGFNPSSRSRENIHRNTKRLPSETCTTTAVVEADVLKSFSEWGETGGNWTNIESVSSLAHRSCAAQVFWGQATSNPRDTGMVRKRYWYSGR